MDVGNRISQYIFFFKIESATSAQRKNSQAVLLRVSAEEIKGIMNIYLYVLEVLEQVTYMAILGAGYVLTKFLLIITFCYLGLHQYNISCSVCL